jgi:hypothetical protein
MTVPVPARRVGLAYSGVVGGAPVQGIDWEHGVSLLNWLVGHGRVLVPCYRPDHPEIPDTETGLLLYPAWLDFSYPTIDWVAVAEITPVSQLEPGSDTEQIVSPAARRSAYAIGGVSGAIGVQGPTGGGWRVSMVGAYEIPRVAIEQTIDAGGATGLETISGQPIKWETALEQMHVQSQRTRHGRRVLWQRANPFATRIAAVNLMEATGFAVRVTSSSFVDVTPPIPTLARRLTAVGAGFATCHGRAYTYHIGTATGEVRFVSTVANGSIVASSPTAGWTSPSVVWVTQERTSDPAGIPAGGIDFVTVQARRVSGSGEVLICAETLLESYS